MATLLNDRILKACRGQAVDRTPVWLMRQAGGYLPEYREVRKDISFFDACRNPEIASVLTLQPLERFDIDAVVLFSDILVIQDAMGYGVELTNKGIKMQTIAQDWTKLLTVEPSAIVAKLNYVYKAIEATLGLLRGRVPLIGFAGAPWTLLGYLIDGTPPDGKTDNVNRFLMARKLLGQDATLAKELLNKMAELIAAHLIAQIRAGCHLVQIFDSWAGLLSPDDYCQFAIPALRRVVELVKEACPDTPIICFAKDTGDLIELIAEVPFDIISVDYDTDLANAKKRLQAAGKNVGLQGNLDPSVILGTIDSVDEQTEKMIRSMGNQRHYIANLGHGCLHEFDPEHVKHFVDAVHKYSAQMIAEQ